MWPCRCKGNDPQTEAMASRGPGIPTPRSTTTSAEPTPPVSRTPCCLQRSRPTTDTVDGRRNKIATAFRNAGCHVTEVSTPLGAIAFLGGSRFELGLIAIADTVPETVTRTLEALPARGREPGPGPRLYLCVACEVKRQYKARLNVP